MSEDSTPYHSDRLDLDEESPLVTRQVLAHYPKANYLKRGAIIGATPAAFVLLGGDVTGALTVAMAGGLMGFCVGYVAMIAVGEHRYSAWANRQRGR